MPQLFDSSEQTLLATMICKHRKSLKHQKKDAAFFLDRLQALHQDQHITQLIQDTQHEIEVVRCDLKLLTSLEQKIFI